MPEDEKTGTPWTDIELDAIVADYFSMLLDEISGTPYVKSRHNAALMAQIRRSHRSVEFKHQNISAVMNELGLPWIPGYRPKVNYQNAIFDAIDRFLTVHPAVFEIASLPPTIVSAEQAVFVEAPPPIAVNDRIPERLRRLVRKFDPAERDRRNRSLGRAGEAFVVDVERARLAKLNRQDLAEEVRWVADIDGDGAGYDVLSFDPSERQVYIEVKTTNGSSRTPFFISRNEYDLAAERPSEWRIYRVHLFSSSPRIFTINPPLSDALRLAPELWKASI